MKTRSLIYKLTAASLAAAVAVPLGARAEVSDADFNALKDAVKKMGGQLQKLQTEHEADQATHQQDVQEIKQLKEKLTETQKATEEVSKEAQYHIASQSQPTAYMQPTDGATVNHNFSILGDAEFKYAKSGSDHGGFMFSDFAPIFLYRGGDNILFEAGFDFILQNNSSSVIGSSVLPGSSLASVRAPGYATTLNLSFAQLDYVINDYMTLAAGNILLPMGVYSERTAGWLNKIPDDPMPRGLVPGTGIGAQLRGALSIADNGQLLNYAVWGVNGPGSADGTGAAAALDLGGNTGNRMDGSTGNLHGHPSAGARIGYFKPFAPHYDIEIGLAAQSGEWDDAGQHLWTAGVVDATVHLGPYIEARGEYIKSRYGSDDVGNVAPEGWWVQAGYKLAGLNLDFPGLSNLELVGRFDRLNDGMGTSSRRYTVGYIYYITNTLLFEGDYEFLHSSDPSQSSEGFVMQLSYGF